VPVCQSGSIEQVVTDRSTDGHCDCAFWINYYRWCWSDIGALIAPRPFLMAAGSEDVLWRPSGYRDVAHRIRHQYAALDAGDKFDLVEDLSPHGYTPKLRQAIFTFFNTHLKQDPSPVNDDVTDFVEPEENLLVFGGKLPENDRMAEIDRLLVKRPELPEINQLTEETWNTLQQNALKKLKATTFRHTHSTAAPRLRMSRDDGQSGNRTAGTQEFHSMDGMQLSLRTRRATAAEFPLPLLVLAAQPDARSTFNGGGSSLPSVSDLIGTAVVEVRHTAATSVGPGYLWTARRTYPLLGETLPERQVSDLLAAVRLLRSQEQTGPIAVYGHGPTAPLAVYAALLDDGVTEIVLSQPPVTHEDPETPEFLGVLRVGDLPFNLALAYPRPITFVGKMPEEYSWTKQLYEHLGAGDKIRVVPSLQNWQPTQR